MEAKYTPGPWDKHDIYIHGGSMMGGLIAQVHDRAAINKVCAEAAGNISIEEAQANARLIAAAPDLLAALENLIGFLVYTGFSEEDDEAISPAKAAIAKARGGA